uniref:Uncharacterized protein n=1 Tax=Anguilla anguilla TaxID=7936 RepID=A0A0E9SXJ7_ANGAN
MEKLIEQLRDCLKTQFF